MEMGHQHTGVVGEDGGVAGGKVKGAAVAVSCEDGGAGVALVEVEPFFGLGGC